MANEVVFEGGGRAVVLSRGEAGLPANRPVLLVCGGADDLKDGALAAAEAVVGDAVARAAEATGAVVVDGGTDSGVMRLVGRARRKHPAAIPVLVGVAPAGLVSAAAEEGKAALEPNHTHFVLADSDEWGGETELLFDTAARIAGTARVAVVVAGGGEVARSEVAHALRRGWPVLAVAGTGGAAAEVEASFGDATQLARRLTWELTGAPVLKEAWQQFATYDGLAKSLRRTFVRFQRAILLLGILATLLALLEDATGSAALHWAVVAAPVLVAVLIALANNRAAGERWVLLRAAAEAIKTEIYRYRTATGVYAQERLPDADPAARPVVLASRLQEIEDHLIQTEASGAPLTPYDGPLPPRMYGAEAEDDGVTPLDPDRYLAIRVADQLGYYHRRIRALDRTRTLLQTVGVLAGGAGAILAAAGAEVWIGLTTAISGAALAYLGTLQVDSTVVTYNQTASRLTALRRDWGVRARRDPEAFDELVTKAEGALGTELGGWVQQMNTALEELQAQQAKPKET